MQLRSDARCRRSTVVHTGRPVPEQHRAVSWAPYRFSSRLKWTVIRAAHRLGTLPALPGTFNVSVKDLGQVDWQSLGWDGTTRPVPFVYIGTPSPTRKAVVHLVDSATGKCRAVVKVPLTVPAKLAVVHEADTLQELSRSGFPRAPELLFVDRQRGIASQTAVAGEPGHRRFSQSYWELLKSLMLPGRAITIASARKQIQVSLRALDATTQEFSFIGDCLSQLQDDQTLPACWVHGDFAPWNLRQTSQGSALLLDWEDAHSGDLPLQDAFHFMHIQDYLFGGRPSPHWADVDKLGARLGFSRSQCRDLEIVYLIRAFLRKNAQQNRQHANFLRNTLRFVSNTTSA